MQENNMITREIITKKANAKWLVLKYTHSWLTKKEKILKDQIKFTIKTYNTEKNVQIQQSNRK